MVKLVECPRDAMQGILPFIPTEQKIRYINQLLRVGFDTIDFGSFVSEKAIPQMKDTAEVLSKLDLSAAKSRLLAIVANVRGAETAAKFGEIGFLGYPFSISETFQQRNTNSSIAQSLIRVEDIQNICVKTEKKLVIYISMGFGNPYGDEWHPDIVTEWCRKLHETVGVDIIALSDTIGIAQPDSISSLFNTVIPALPAVEFGAHLHTRPDAWRVRIEAAYNAGCRRFDGALKGFGGCPMASDELTGNMPTENMVLYFKEIGQSPSLDSAELSIALMMAAEIFPH